MVRPFLMDLFKGELLDMEEQAAFQKLVELVRTTDAPNSLVTKTALLEQSYQFWMAGKTDVTEAFPIQKRLARVAPGILLNRFSTDTTNTVPVGLNALLHGLETKLAKCYELKKADVQRKTYQSLADFRQAAILKFCWNEKEGRFSDLVTNYICV
ncbi:MAG: trehalase family glycosidase [Chitinophagales bacterium]